MSRTSILTAFLAILAGSLAAAEPVPDKETRNVSLQAKGTFEVKIAPLAFEEGVAPGKDAEMGRMSIDKVFQGDLEGTGHGQMLTAGVVSTGSGVYVAVEKVAGKLQGREGSFLLHHRGVMTRGTPSLEVVVVPESGTGQLAGIAGTFKIVIDEGKHFYELDYTLPSP